MISGQKSYGSNGKQNFLFPLEYMYLSQGEYQYTYSHNGTYAMDFIGWGANGRINHCPYYAPFDCKCVAKWGSKSPMAVWQSIDEVNFVDGTTGYATIGFCHDNNLPSIVVGATRRQGDVIGHTGTYGASADHVHMEVKKGKYTGYYKNSYGVYQLKNENHIYDCVGVNNTVLYKDYYVNHQGTTITYNWRTFSGVVPPIPPIPHKKEHKYPWYTLTSKKLHRM